MLACQVAATRLLDTSALVHLWRHQQQRQQRGRAGRHSRARLILDLIECRVHLNSTKRCKSLLLIPSIARICGGAPKVAHHNHQIVCLNTIRALEYDAVSSSSSKWNSWLASRRKLESKTTRREQEREKEKEFRPQWSPFAVLRWEQHAPNHEKQQEHQPNRAMCYLD